LRSRANHALDSRNHITRTVSPSIDFAVRAASLLGLLDPKPVSEPNRAPLRTETKGHWSIAVHKECSVWTCRCGRSEPLVVAAEDADKISFPTDHHACEICQHEARSAKGKGQKLLAWLNAHRACLNPDAHLEHPGDCGHTYVSKQDGIVRTRHFIYEQFWKKPVEPGHCVHVKCDNPLCVNPYHLWTKPQRHGKLTPELKKLIVRLSADGISSRSIQLLLQERLSLELSLRSIQKTLKGAKKSKSSDT
jgi:hypothetical protein